MGFEYVLVENEGALTVIRTNNGGICLIVAAAFVAAVLLSGCGSMKRADVGEAEPMFFPKDFEVAGSFDIDVIRVDRKHIRFDNSSVRIFRGARVFLNHDYSADISMIATGKSNLIALDGFVNEHGERYPVGSFLQPEKNRPILLGELVINEKVYKLSARLEKGWEHSY